MSSSRIVNTRRNIIWSFLDYVIAFVFQFVSRTIIVHILGLQYLGLSSLFTSILQVLNMAELGFSTAVIFNMYKPIAENDVETVCSLLSFYRKIYQIVGCIVLVLGLIVMPFLPGLINGKYPDEINIYILYLIYLANAGISYFLWAYKGALLNALQRMDLIKIAYSIVNILQCIFQVFILVVFKNYYLFVVGTVIGSALKNLLSAFFAKKHFPQYYCKGDVSKSVKQDIWQRVKGLLVCRISGVTYTTFDSIILSSMLGLISVGIYNNYLTVYNGVASIIVLIRQAMQASVGNSVAKDSVEKNYNDIFVWQFAFSAISIVCSTSLLCLYQPFMSIWMGENMLLPKIDIIILCGLFFISTVQYAFYLYLSGNGLWWELRWPYIMSTIANLIMNVLFCKLWNTTGIILATFVAQFVFGLVWQSNIIFKKYFRKSALLYYKKQIVYAIAGVIVSALVYGVCSMIHLNGIIEIVVKLAICMIITPLLVVALFWKTDVYRKCIILAKRTIRMKV